MSGDFYYLKILDLRATTGVCEKLSLAFSGRPEIIFQVFVYLVWRRKASGVFRMRLRSFVTTSGGRINKQVRFLCFVIGGAYIVQ